MKDPFPGPSESDFYENKFGDLVIKQLLNLVITEKYKIKIKFGLFLYPLKNRTLLFQWERL